MSLNSSSTCPTKLEKEVNQTVKSLETCMIDMNSDPTLMLNFKSEVQDITTIDLTGDEAILRYPPLRGNISGVPQDDINTSAAAPSHLSHSHDAHDESFLRIAPSHAGSAVASAIPSTSGLQGILTNSLIINKKTFSPKSIERVKSDVKRKSSPKFSHHWD